MEYEKDFYEALKIRVFEEKLLELFNKGLINGTVHTCIGQEIIAVTVSKYCQKDDYFFSNHRGHGHYLSKTKDYKGLLAEVMGKNSGCTRGIGGSQHLVNDFFLSNGIQGGMVPIAAGVALGRKSDPSNPISVAFIGDGTLGQGVLWETLNIAACWSLPLLIVLEDNGYAQSTSKSETFSGDMEKRIAGFGVQYFSTHSNDIVDINRKIESAVKITREKRSPCLVHIETYRLKSHSKGDDNRNPEEIASAERLDILNIFNKEKETCQDHHDKISNYKDELDIIADELKKEKPCENLSLLENIQRFCDKEYSVVDYYEEAGVRINDEIYKALDNLFKETNAIMIGEDIKAKSDYTVGVYGGAFKVTKDLSTKYPGRIINTPISEQAIVGIATGLSLTGKKSICEIMFGDFNTLIIDQLYQHACKFKTMYAGKVIAPIVIRSPMGGGRGYGPTHSQSLEPLLYSIPGLRILALNKYISPEIIYKNTSESDDPTFIIENKKLYTQTKGMHLPGFYFAKVSNEQAPTILITPRKIKTNLTIVSYGEVAGVVEKALEELALEEVFVDFIVLSSLCPINTNEILKSAQKNKKLLTVEESSYHGGVMCSLTNYLTGLISNLKYDYISNEHTIPCERLLEYSILPNKEKIINKSKGLVYGL